MKADVRGESKLIRGHVLDVAVTPLVSSLRRYDPQLYLKWNPKKRSGRGVWELRRKPEMKSVREGRFVDTPFRGRVFFPGDVYDCGDYFLSVPKYNETSAENHVKDFEILTYQILDWVAKHDLFQYGYRGRGVMAEAEYREAKYEEKIDEEAAAEKDYMIRQHRTEINDFREYVLAGGNPYRLLDYWGK